MVLSWLLFALLTPLCYSISSLLDKFLFVEHMSIRHYLQVMGIVNGVIGLILLVMVPLRWDSLVWLAFVPGLLWACIYVFYLKALRYEEVSRVIGIIYTLPIFVALFAVIFLDEMLSFFQYGGIALVVVGALLLAFRQVKGYTVFSRAVPWLVLAIFFETAVELLDKYLLYSLSFFQVQTLFSLGVFIGCVPSFFRRVSWSSNSGIVVVSQFFINLASFFFVIAASLTEVSRVAGVISIQPAVTLLFAVLVSFFKPGWLEEELKMGKIIFKAIAIILVLLGVYLLSR